MTVNKLLMWLIFIIAVGSMGNLVNQLIFFNQNAELIQRVNYLNELVEGSGGGR